MKFNERKDFLYDATVFRRSDVATALGIHKEMVSKHSPMPPPRFFEVDRSEGNFDPLWHMPVGQRTVFSRQIDMPALVTFQKPDWRLTMIGVVPQRRDNFWLDNTLLLEADYFPMRGDMVFYNGYRYIVINVVIEPNGYWHQTNVWLGLICECEIAIDGDARPVVNPAVRVPAEIKGVKVLPEA